MAVAGLLRNGRIWWDQHIHRCFRDPPEDLLRTCIVVQVPHLGKFHFVAIGGLLMVKVV